MKRLIVIVMICLLLAGCTPKLAQTEDTGNPWDPNWTVIGTAVGVSNPASGLTLSEYNDVQGLDGIYYAAFTLGEAEKITNDEGKEADLYPAQLYLLTQECLSREETEKSLSRWKTVGESGYSLTELETRGEFTLWRMEPRDGSVFVSGVLALGVHGDTAVSAELMCAEEIFENDAEVLAEFLSCLHFRAQED